MMIQKKLEKEKILITMGDAAGIGPEISLKAAMDKNIRNKCVPIIIGDLEVLKRNYTILFHKNSPREGCPKGGVFLNLSPVSIGQGLPCSYPVKPSCQDRKTSNHQCRHLPLCKIKWNVLDEKLGGKDVVCEKNVVNMIDIKFNKGYKIKFGKPDEITGKYSFLYLQKAVELINSSFANKLVTAPISKKAWREAGILYPAHTEALAGMTNTKKYAMIFANKDIKVVLATRHIAVKDIEKEFNKKNLEDAIDVGIQFLDMLGIGKKRIGVCGLNPHAGEDGCNGDEEAKIIEPVLNRGKYKKINFYGPVSGDAIFHKAMENEIDLVIAAYHDQGIFPLKAIDYFGCVNITVGLPFIRVSPGHGTAFDIAGKNIANPDAMIAAINWALMF